jgi:hypothetical protein
MTEKKELTIGIINNFSASDNLTNEFLGNVTQQRFYAIWEPILAYIGAKNSTNHETRQDLLKKITNDRHYFSYSNSTHKVNSIFTKNNIGYDKIKIDIVELDKIYQKFESLNWSEESLFNYIKDDFEQNKNLFKIELLSKNLKNINFDFGLKDINFEKDFKEAYKDIDPNKKYFKELNDLLFKDYSILSNFYSKKLKDYHDQIKKAVFRDNKTVLDESSLNFDPIFEKYIREKYITNNSIQENIFSSKEDFFNFSSIKEQIKSNIINILSTENNGIEFFVKDLVNYSDDSYGIKYILNFNSDNYKNTLKNIEKTLSYKKPIFLIIYGFNNKIYLNEKDTIDNIINNTNNFIINIYFDEKEVSEIKNKINNDNKFDFDIFKFKADKNNYPSFVKNIYTEQIYKSCSEKSKKSISSLYEAYYKNMVEDLESSYRDYKKEELFDDLQKIAYITRYKELRLTHLGFKNINSSIKYYLERINWLITLDENGTITFGNETYKAFFISRYLTSNVDEFKNIKLDDKYFEKISIFLAEDIPTEDFINQYPDLFEKILSNVRKFKYKESQKKLIDDIKKSNINNTKLLKEVAKYYYFKSKYEESVEETLKILKIEYDKETKNYDLISELYNLLASCLFDLNLNTQAEEICQKALELDSKEYKSKILGTLGRIYLRKKDFEQAKNMFNAKSKSHDVDSLDNLRDKSDLLLVKIGEIVETNKKITKNVLEEYFKETKKLEGLYIKNFNDLNPKYNSMYSWMNLSHLLPNLTSSESEEFSHLKILSKNTINKEAQAIINFNLGKYFTKSKKGEDSPIDYIKVAVNIFENELPSSYYAYKASMYLNKIDNTLIDKINSHFIELKKQSEKIKDLFAQQDIIHLKDKIFDIGISEIKSTKDIEAYIKNDTGIII